MSWVLFFQLFILIILLALMIMTVVNSAIEKIYLGKAALSHKPQSFFKDDKDQHLGS